MSTTEHCPQCGNPREAAASICSRCGGSFPGASPYATPPSLRERPRIPAPEPGGLLEPGSIDFDAALSRGFALYTDRFGPLLLVGLVFCSVQLGVALLQQIPVLNAVVMLVAPFTIQPVVNAGFCLVCLAALRGGEVKVDDLFVEFRALGELALLALFHMLLWLGALMPPGVLVAVGAVPMLLAMEDNPSYEPQLWQWGLMIGGGVLLVLVGLILALALAWSYPAFVDRRAGAWDAIKVSAQIARNSPLEAFGVWVISSVVGGIGLLGCGVGIIFTIPIAYCLLVAAYRTAVPVPGERGGSPQDERVRVTEAG